MRLNQVRLHFKTELCDGEIHMTAEEYWRHKIKENHEKQRRVLKKLSNNPILAEEYRYVIHQALININLVEFWKHAYEELRDKYDREHSRSRPYQSSK